MAVISPHNTRVLKPSLVAVTLLALGYETIGWRIMIVAGGIAFVAVLVLTVVVPLGIWREDRYATITTRAPGASARITRWLININTRTPHPAEVRQTGGQDQDGQFRPLPPKGAP
ncbi:hypothetical protein [Nonomuraea endophytica]|uniref:hypothetical protein n=1 Tax=Nonomuraea endophytica TaxID=714136 RepID=UPI0037C831CC